MHTFILEPEDTENNHPAVLVSPPGMSEDAAAKTIQAASIKHRLIALEQGEDGGYEFESHILEELKSMGFVMPEHSFVLSWDAKITDRAEARSQLAKLLKSGAREQFTPANPAEQPEREMIRIPSVSGDPDDTYHLLPPVGMSTEVALATVNKIIIRRGVELRRNNNAALELADCCADGRELHEGILREVQEMGFGFPMFADEHALVPQSLDDDDADELSDECTHGAVPSQLLPFCSSKLKSLGMTWEDVCTQFNLPKKSIEEFHPNDQYKYIADYVKWRHDEEMKATP
jgi:hypothetical protein